MGGLGPTYGFIAFCVSGLGCEVRKMFVFCLPLWLGQKDKYNFCVHVIQRQWREVCTSFCMSTWFSGNGARCVPIFVCLRDSAALAQGVCNFSSWPGIGARCVQFTFIKYPRRDSIGCIKMGLRSSH